MVFKFCGLSVLPAVLTHTLNPIRSTKSSNRLFLRCTYFCTLRVCVTLFVAICGRFAHLYGNLVRPQLPPLEYAHPYNLKEPANNYEVDRIRRGFDGNGLSNLQRNREVRTYSQTICENIPNGNLVERIGKKYSTIFQTLYVQRRVNNLLCAKHS